MECLAIVVLRKSVLLAVECELTISNTVCYRAYNCSEVALAGVVDVAVDILVTYLNVSIFAVAVRSPKRYYTRTIIGNLHYEVAVAESVECNLFAINGCLEILLVKECEFVRIVGARNCHCCQQNCKNCSHIFYKYLLVVYDKGSKKNGEKCKSFI